jgi:hypothetical protein
VLVVFRGIETTSDTHFHFERELGVPVEGADVLVLVDDLVLSDLLDISSSNGTGLVDGERKGGRILVLEVLELDLLEIEDNLGDVFDDTGKRGKLVLSSGDTDGSDGGSLERGEENTSEAVAYGVTETCLERLCREFGVGVGCGIFVFYETFWDFKRS